MKPITEMIHELLISMGIMKRTKPIEIAPILGGIEKLREELLSAIDINQELVLQKERASVLAEEERKEKIDRMEEEMAEAIKAIQTAHDANQRKLKDAFDAEKATAKGIVETARAESEKATIVVYNLTAITTKRLVATE